MKKIELSVPDMSCGHCVSSISGVLKIMQGIDSFDVILDTKTVEITFDESSVKLESIVESLEDIGFCSTIK